MCWGVGENSGVVDVELMDLLGDWCWEVSLRRGLGGGVWAEGGRSFRMRLAMIVTIVAQNIAGSWFGTF